MSSVIECSNGHRNREGVRINAMHFAETKELGLCKRCGEILHYYVVHRYPKGKGVVTAKYEVVQVVRLKTDCEANEEGFDPMVLVLKKLGSTRKLLWPYYWVKDRKNNWANGQFPPLLSIHEFKGLLERIEEA